MRKKIFAFFMAAAMISGMTSTVFAASVDDSNPSNTSDVKATYVQGSTSDTIYSVDVVWGNMEFTYTAPWEGTWNPGTHTYDGAGKEGVWSCEDGANVIKMVNHSNAAVTANVAYNKGADYQGISGTFGKNTLSAPTAVGTEYEAAPSDSTTLSLNGTLIESAEQVTVGTVTLTLYTE